MSAARLARAEIQALVAYEAAAQRDDSVRLNANEVPDSNSPSAGRRPMNRYPEVRPLRLQRALASRFGCAPQQLLVTRGSSEAIDLIIRAFCRAGKDNIVIPTPCFAMYRHYAKVQGAGIIERASRAEQDFQVDVAALLTACTETTQVLFVCSPNNPTGAPIPRENLVALIEGRSEQSVVVVDEAYIEFSKQQSVVELLRQYPNLLILRTLSKAMGFAGARCGAVIGAADVIRLLSAIQAPYALATPVVECVEDALQSNQLAAADNLVKQIVSERDRLYAALKNYRFVLRVWPSEANFLLLQVGDARQLLEHCEARNILLRTYDDKLPGCIRITIGSPQENDHLLRALDLLQEQLNG